MAGLVSVNEYLARINPLRGELTESGVYGNLSDFPGEFAVRMEEGDRGYQEDVAFSHTIEVAGVWATVAGVCDGHGGDEAARFLGKYYGEGLILAVVGRSPGTSVPAAVASYHTALGKRMEQMDVGIGDGSTLCAVLFLEGSDVAYTINVGDSRVIAWAEDAGDQLLFASGDHTPETEEAGVRAAGGTVVNANPWGEPKLRIYGPAGTVGLAVGRSFGDRFLDVGKAESEPPIMSNAPDVFELAVTPSTVFYIATDGVWDLVTPEDVANCGPPSESRQACVERVHSGREFEDNATSVSVIYEGRS